jgi:hypothetical protein
MSDPVTGDGQSETSSVSSKLAQSMFRSQETPSLLSATVTVAVVIFLGFEIGNLHGWRWALAGAGVLAVLGLWSYQFSAKLRSYRIARWLNAVVVKAVNGITLMFGLALVAVYYFMILIAPYVPGIQTWEVGRPTFVHFLIIGILMAVTFMALFPLIEPQRRAWLVWRVTQGRLIAKSMYALAFALIVSASIALWDQLLLLLAKHDMVRFYQMLPKAGPAPAGRPVTDLIHGNDILLLLLWQLGDMVPTLKVNDTIGFEQPLFYTSSVVGWLVLAFKVIVGFALIGGVLAIVKAERAKPDKPPQVSLLPWRRRAWRARPDRQAPEIAGP